MGAAAKWLAGPGEVGCRLCRAALCMEHPNAPLNSHTPLAIPSQLGPCGCTWLPATYLVAPLSQPEMFWNRGPQLPPKQALSVKLSGLEFVTKESTVFSLSASWPESPARARWTLAACRCAFCLAWMRSAMAIKGSTGAVL